MCSVVKTRDALLDRNWNIRKWIADALSFLMPLTCLTIDNGLNRCKEKETINIR